MMMPSVWENQVEALTPGYGLVSTWLLNAFGEGPSGPTISFSLPPFFSSLLFSLCYSALQINENEKE